MQIIGARVKPILLAAAAIGTFSWQQPAQAAPATEQEYHLPAQDLGSALRTVARISGHEIMFAADAVEGKRSPDLNGRFTLKNAINLLLKGSGLAVKSEDGDALILGRSTPSSAEVTDSADDQSDIVVTGSRIRGAPIASSVISITQAQMRDAGQNTLADVIRDIPQNFGGGQNPGIGLNVPEGNGVSYGAVSSINLRGLGSDATLTLLNGHRLTYSVADQAIDISAIPMLAVDRIEIVADGASALYGSDAVAGVANIILKRDYQGLSTSARFGASTGGGNQQQQYDVIGGAKWGSGGFFAAYEYERDTPIKASQRDYAASRAPGLYLYPALRHHNVIASAHQLITDNLRFNIDALYNKRWTYTQYALDSRGDPLAYGSKYHYRNENFAVALSLTATFSNNWEVSALGMFGLDRTHYEFSTYLNSVPIFQQIGCYCNTASSAELNANGPLFHLPGGDAKLAIGGGYRSNSFHSLSVAGGGAEIRKTQRNYYGFGELSIPLISPEQDLPFAYRLNFSGALRYEDYPGVDQVLTPKLGLIYSPTADVDLKGSWGKSFKAPTLYDRYSTQYATLYSAASRGGTGYPAAATVLLVAGGNADLKPERATTWSATFAAHPRAWEGATFEVSYFNVHYRDRIVTPIAFTGQSLSNSIYADLVNFNPSDVDKADAIAGADVFQNGTAASYNPSNVVAIINNLKLNVAQQMIHGVDVSAQYRIALTGANSLTLSGNGSYIDSTQKLSPLQPETNLAGILFNPPHFRGRAGAVWNAGTFTLASWLNYAGGVTDTRTTVYAHVRPMTTVDLTARYRIDRGGALLRGTELSLSIRNIADTKPSLIRSTQPYETPYDSTNYSPFGRVISFQVIRKW